MKIIKDGNVKWNVKEPCTVLYRDGESEVELPALIKCRGGFSSKYPKHSYSLTLDEEFNLGNVCNDDDWILNANYIDKTFMRHKISYDLFREMNKNNIAARSSYTNVSVNGNYEGLYVLMEEINAGMIKLDKYDTLAMLFKDPPVFIEGRHPHPQDLTNYYQQKFPKIHKSDKTYYVERFRNFLFDSDDNEFAEKIASWVDIENVIDWHILLLLTNNSDGILKNFYMYKLNGTTPFRFAIWDYDHSFGRDSDNELNMMERELDCNRSILLKRLLAIRETGYSEKMRNRWHELRKQNIISVKHFEKHIERIDRVIRTGISRNTEKWPVNAKWYFDDNDYREEIAIMEEYVEKRIAKLDKYFNREADLLSRR